MFLVMWLSLLCVGTYRTLVSLTSLQSPWENLFFPSLVTRRVDLYLDSLFFSLQIQQYKMYMVFVSL